MAGIHSFGIVQLAGTVVVCGTVALLAEMQFPLY